MEIRTNIKKPQTMKEIMWEHYEATLRDDFAKSALVLITNTEIIIDPDSFAQIAAEEAYRVADAMLKARQKKND